VAHLPVAGLLVVDICARLNWRAVSAPASRCDRRLRPPSARRRRTTAKHGRVREQTGCLRAEITLAFGADGSLTDARAWGLPGGPPHDRPTRRLLQSAA
jgi:hypothetical protein